MADYFVKQEFYAKKKPIGYTIQEYRISKGYTQEELAEKANVNMKTIQRIENGKSTPRGTTLLLLCSALEVEREDIITKSSQEHNYADLVVNTIFLLVFNTAFAFILGWLTIADEASLTTRLVALPLTLLLAYLIVAKTMHLAGFRRFLKFGFGGILLILFLLLPTVTIQKAIFSGALILALAYLAILFYGSDLIPFLKSLYNKILKKE